MASSSKGAKDDTADEDENEVDEEPSRNVDEATSASKANVAEDEG